MESMIIIACQNGSLYRVSINNCVAHSIESIIITACQNGSLYNNNYMPEWLTIIIESIINNCMPEWLTIIVNNYARMAHYYS